MAEVLAFFLAAALVTKELKKMGGSGLINFRTGSVINHPPVS